MDNFYEKTMGLVEIYTFVNGMHNIKMQSHVNKDILHTLFYIKNSETSVTPKVLTTYLKVSKPRISKVLEPLLEKGYIITRPSTQDKRSYTLHMSEEGEVFLKNSMQELYHLQERLVQTMGFGEYIQFLDLINKANQIFKQ